MEKKKQSKQTRCKHDEGFKTEALRMVTAGRSTAEVARSLGIGERSNSQRIHLQQRIGIPR
jgi:transposase-like protein